LRIVDTRAERFGCAVRTPGAVPNIARLNMQKASVETLAF